MTWGNSVIKVVFRDEFFEEKYRSKIENFLKEILDPDENFILNSQVYDNAEQEFRKNQDSFQAEKLNKQHQNAVNSQSNIPIDLEIAHLKRESEIVCMNSDLEITCVNSDSKISLMSSDSKSVSMNSDSKIAIVSSDSEIIKQCMNSDSEIPPINCVSKIAHMKSDLKIVDEYNCSEIINVNNSSQKKCNIAEKRKCVSKIAHMNSDLKITDVYNSPDIINVNNSSQKEQDIVEKRKNSGRMSEIMKRMRHSTHELGPDCECKRFRCFEIVPAHERIRIIREFNELSSYDEQNQYLTGLITVLPVTRHRNRKPISETALHTCSTTYSIRVLSHSTGIFEYFQICYKAFMSLHGITSRRIQTIRESILTTGAAPVDKRGKHSNRPHKVSEETKAQIEDFIQTLVSKEFPNSLTENTKLCLSKDFSVKKMYKIFLEKNPNIYVSCVMFRTIFNNKYNV